MEINKLKTKRRERRKRRIRRKILGTLERPRMSVFRSHKNIYVQIIDDLAGRTLCEASTQAKDLRGTVPYGGNRAAAAVIGKTIAERAQSKGITAVSLDRNGFKYHGRIKALADAAREAGLKF